MSTMDKETANVLRWVRNQIKQEVKSLDPEDIDSRVMELALLRFSDKLESYIDKLDPSTEAARIV